MDDAEPIVLSIDLPVAPEEAYEAFAPQFACWWPASTYSLSRDVATACRLSPVPGGAIEERGPDGVWRRWGTVESVTPGRRLRFSWHPGREPDSAQWVEVLFAPARSGSSVTLTHGGWEALGEIAPILRREYVAGWREVLNDFFARFAQAAH
jgi:uncharacterized protein YndB with AHSA1/START domain